jgi:hypothetical protein
MSLFRGRVLEAFALGAFIVACRALTAGAQDSIATTAKFVLPPIETHGFLEIYYRSGDPLTKDGYRLRKADLKFSGAISPKLRWRISFDAGKALTLNTTTGTATDGSAVSGVSVDQRSRILQDAALTYTVNKVVGFDVGQQVVPLGYEGTQNTWNMETIERANFEVERSRAVGLGDVRDIGASANGLANGLEYHVGMFNEMGDDQGSTTDANQAKAVLSRFAYHAPFLPGFQIGGTGGYEPGLRTQAKSRAASEMQYRNSKFTLRGETMEARDGLLRRFGWYGLGAYRVRPDVQLVARFDSWDRDKTAENALSNALERQIVGGFSYFIEGGNAKLAINVIRQTFPNISTVRDATIGLFAFQAQF